MHPLPLSNFYPIGFCNFYSLVATVNRISSPILPLKSPLAITPGYDQVEAIRSWIQREIRYQYGTSNASTSAIDTAQQKEGVCRDFAHLGIALCRAINIPARW